MSSNRYTASSLKSAFERAEERGHLMCWKKDKGKSSWSSGCRRRGCCAKMRVVKKGRVFLLSGDAAIRVCPVTRKYVIRSHKDTLRIIKKAVAELG